MREESFDQKEQSSSGSVFVEPIVRPRHISHADILKGCSLRLSQLTLLVLPNLLWLSFGLGIIMLNLSVLILVIFVQDTRYYIYKKSLASIN